MRIVISVLLYFVFYNLVYAVSHKGLPIIKNFKPEEYGGGSRIYSIACSDYGLMFVGDKNGILEFNGQSWHKINCGFAVTSLAIDANKEVFVAGTKGIGKLVTDSTNTLTYKSLNNLITNEESIRKFRFSKVFSIGKKVVFVLGNEILINTEESIRIIELPHRFTYYQKLDGELYFYSPKNGVFKLIGNKITPIYSSDNIKNKDIRGFLRIKDNLALLINGEGIFSPKTNRINSAIELNESLTKWSVQSIKQLDSINYLINSFYHGAIMIDTLGKVTNRYHFDIGLNNNTIFCGEKDNWNNLWIGTASGISSIRLNFSYSKYNSPKGIGTGYASKIFNNHLYFATSQGLYQYIKNDKEEAEFKKIYKGHVWGLHIIEGALYFGHASGMYALKNDNIKKVSNLPGGWYIKQIPFAPEYYLTGTPVGLMLLKNNNANSFLTEVRLFKDVKENFKNIEFDDANYIWTECRRGIYKLKLTDNLDAVKSQRKFDRIETNNKLKLVRRINNRLSFIADSGIYTINHKDYFNRDSTFNSLYSSNFYPTNIIVDQYDRFWIFSNGNLMCYQLINKKLKRIVFRFNFSNHAYPNDYENIYCINENDAIVGQEEGFLGVDIGSNSYAPYSANRINKIIVTDNKGAQYRVNIKETTENHSQHIKVNTKIPYGNSIKFYFSSGYSNHGAVVYSTTLVGFDKLWSNWSDETIREFTNLPSGKYKFLVRSNNKSNEHSVISFCDFEILLPWYLTTKVKVIAIVLLVILIILTERGIRYRFKRIRLKMEKQQEEKIFREKQKQKEEELIQQKDSIKQRNLQLRADNLSKSRELANTTMDIIEKNQFLTDLKVDLEKIKELSELNKVVTHDIKGVIRKIDRDIDNEENWKVFEDYFDKVHEKFLKRMKEKYPQLTAKDLRLSAYLRMNLSTKEIAPLLNISIRGVEISRYRLRKKLELDRNENLNEFLLKF